MKANSISYIILVYNIALCIAGLSCDKANKLECQLECRSKYSGNKNFYNENTESCEPWTDCGTDQFLDYNNNECSSGSEMSEVESEGESGDIGSNEIISPNTGENIICVHGKINSDLGMCVCDHGWYSDNNASHTYTYDNTEEAANGENSENYTNSTSTVQKCNVQNEPYLNSTNYQHESAPKKKDDSIFKYLKNPWVTTGVALILLLCYCCCAYKCIQRIRKKRKKNKKKKDKKRKENEERQRRRSNGGNNSHHDKHDKHHHHHKDHHNGYEHRHNTEEENDSSRYLPKRRSSMSHPNLDSARSNQSLDNNPSYYQPNNPNIIPPTRNYLRVKREGGLHYPPRAPIPHNISINIEDDCYDSNNVSFSPLKYQNHDQC